MAQRRMFSLKVIDTDSFLDMSPTAQNLYFHLGMRADDDGFIANPKRIMQLSGAPDDDMKVLIAKGFIIPMATNGICVITHWKMNNLIRPDRYVETEYKDEKSRLVLIGNKWQSGAGIPNVIPNDNQVTPQYRIGKDRIGKDSKDTIPAPSAEEEKLIADLIFAFKDVNPNYKTLFNRNPQRTAVKRMLAEHGEDKLRKIIAYLPKNNATEFSPTITTPVELENKMGALMASVQKIKSKNSVIGIAI